MLPATAFTRGRRNSPATPPLRHRFGGENLQDSVEERGLARRVASRLMGSADDDELLLEQPYGASHPFGVLNSLLGHFRAVPCLGFKDAPVYAIRRSGFQPATTIYAGCRFGTSTR